MTPDGPRGVTRGYVVGLIGAVTILALAVVVALWGAISLATGAEPVRSEDASFSLAPLIVAVAVAALVVVLWNASISLLRGRTSPPLAHAVTAGFGVYLLWCLAGAVAGLASTDTWLSVYPVALGVVWFVAPILLWAVLYRRRYTDRGTPKWPWERHPAPDDLQYPDHEVDPENDPDAPRDGGSPNGRPPR